MTDLPSVVFVRGCARSGTTLLADIMNESPDVGVMVEQPLGDLAHHLLDIFWFEDHVSSQRETIAAGRNPVKRRNDSEHFTPVENLDRVRFARRYPTRDRFPAILTAVVEAALEKPGLEVIGSKTPGHWGASELAIVTSAFERVRYVFIVRNPFDTVNSIINRRNAARAGSDLWPDKPAIEAIARYQEATCLLLSCRASDGDDCFVVGYDDLIAEPAATLRALGEFLGVGLGDGAALVQKARPAKNVLTADEEALVRSQFGPAIQRWSAKRLTGKANRLADALDDCVRVVEIGKTYRCDAPVGDRGLLGSGWSGAQPRGIWSDAPFADVYFAVPYDGPYAIVLDIAGHVPSRREPLTLALTIAGQRFEYSLRNGRNVRLRCAPVRLDRGRAHRLQFSFGAQSPRRSICLRRFTVLAGSD